MSTLLDADPVVLDQILEDDCKCEFRHRVTSCSIDITHIIVGCHTSTLACQVATDFQRARMQEPKADCRWCGRHIRDCWTIRPI